MHFDHGRRLTARVEVDLHSLGEPDERCRSAAAIEQARYAATRPSGSTESRMPTAFNTARIVLRVGLPFGESAR